MRQGQRFQMHGVRCIYKETTDIHHARIGFVVSKKYGNAVQRNRFKRCWREAFRTHDIKHKDLDILIIPHAGCHQSNHMQENTMNILDQLLQKHGDMRL